MWSPKERQTKGKSKAKQAANGVPSSPTIAERWGKMVDGWFAQAKADDDGRVSGHDAVAFFKRSGLDYDDLAKVWDKVVPANEDRMDRRQFESALKLVAMLQTGAELSDKTAVEAIAQTVPDPEPVFGPLERSPSPSQIPIPPCLNPKAGDTAWRFRKGGAPSKLPSGDDRASKAPAGPVKPSGIDDLAPRSRSFTGMPSSRHDEEGTSPKTPGKREDPPTQKERGRSTSMPNDLTDQDQLGRPATGAFKFEKVDAKVVRASSVSTENSGGWQGPKEDVEKGARQAEGEEAVAVSGRHTVPVGGDHRRDKKRLGNRCRRTRNRKLVDGGAHFMDGRAYGLGAEPGVTAVYDSRIAARSSLEGDYEDFGGQGSRDSPVPDRSDSLDDQFARGSPFPRRRASADNYGAKGGRRSGRSMPDSDAKGRPKSARGATSDDRRAKASNRLDRSVLVNDDVAQHIPVPVPEAEEYASGTWPSPDKGAAVDGAVGGASGTVANGKDAPKGSPNPAKGAEPEARSSTGSAVPEKSADVATPVAKASSKTSSKASSKPRRFEEVEDDEPVGVRSEKFSEGEEQVNNGGLVDGRSVSELVARGTSVGSRPGAHVPRDEDKDKDVGHPMQVADTAGPSMLRSFTPSSLGGRSSRVETAAFSDDMMSELAGSELDKMVYGPCAACSLVDVELRLPPLRPSLTAKLRKVAAVNGSLVAFPSLAGGFLQWIGIQDSLDGIRELQRVPSEDPDSAACAQIDCEEGAQVTSCAVDDASGFMWLGHDNGVVSAWYVGGRPQKISRKVSVWQGHRHGGVSAIAITPWGALWTGSTKGAIRVWESPTSEDGPKKGSTLSRTRGDKPHGTVKFITVSACGSLVWTCGQNKLALWDAYTRRFLGLIDRNNEDRIIDTRRGIEMEEDELVDSMPAVPSSGEHAAGRARQKARHPGGLVSKNGRRVLEMSYTQPQSSDLIPTKMGSIRALVAQRDNTVWVGYKNGVIERYHQNGRFIKRWGLGSRLMCLCSVGEFVWAGLRDGSVIVLRSELEAVFKWQAHPAAIISMAVSGGGVCTLGEEGSIKCWSCQIPNPDLDEEAWVEWQSCADDSVERGQLKVLCGTWNVSHCKPPADSLRDWLGGGEKAGDADVVVVGLQQIEGELPDSSKAAAVDADAGNRQQEQADDKAQWWASELLSALDPQPTSASQEDRWQTVGMRHLSGVLVAVFARGRLCPYIGNVSTSSIPCGVAPSGESKGAVAFQCTLFRRPLLVVASHLSAHQNCMPDAFDDCDLMERVDFDDVTCPDPAGKWGMQMLLEDDGAGRGAALSRAYGGADVVVWLGDFSNSLDVDRDDALAMIRMAMIQGASDGRAAYADLMKYSRCQDLACRGTVFHGLQEAPIAFQPTYKFEKNVSDALAYDSGQAPSYADRIFFRGSLERGILGGDDEYGEDGDLGLEGDPTALMERSPQRHGISDVLVASERYAAALGPCESSHKPVWALLAMDYPVVIQGRKRLRCFEILRQVAAHDVDGAAALVEVALRSNYFELGEGDVQELEVENRGACRAQVSVAADQSFQQFVPAWLQITPVTMCVDPGFSEVFTLAAIVGACDGDHAMLPARLKVRVEGVVGNWGRRDTEYSVDVRLKPSGDEEGLPPEKGGSPPVGEEAC